MSPAASYLVGPIQRISSDQARLSPKNPLDATVTERHRNLPPTNTARASSPRCSPMATRRAMEVWSEVPCRVWPATSVLPAGMTPARRDGGRRRKEEGGLAEAEASTAALLCRRTRASNTTLNIPSPPTPRTPSYLSSRSALPAMKSGAWEALSVCNRDYCSSIIMG